MESEKIKHISPDMLRGHIAILIAGVLWGAMSPVAKGVMVSGAVMPVALSGIRILGGTLVLWVVAAFLPKSVAGDGRLQRGDLWRLLLMSVMIISANQGLFILGIGYTTPFEATVMSTMTPVFTLIFAAIFIAMPLTVMKVAGVALGLGGALLMAFASRGSDSAAIASNPTAGNLMCLCAQICAAVYFTSFRSVIDRYHPLTLLKWLFLMGTLTWVPFTMPAILSIDLQAMDASLWASIIFIVVGPTFISYVCMVYAQQRLRPTTVAMYNYIQPLTAAAIASVMGLAVFGWANIGATLMIFVGVALVAFAPGPMKGRVKQES